MKILNKIIIVDEKSGDVLIFDTEEMAILEFMLIVATAAAAAPGRR